MEKKRENKMQNQNWPHWTTIDVNVVVVVEFIDKWFKFWTDKNKNRKH